MALIGLGIFIASYFMAVNNSSRSYVAAGGGEGLIVLFAFIIFSVTSIHAAIVGFIYLKENPDTFLKTMVFIEFFVPLIIIIGTISYFTISESVSTFKREQRLNHAVNSQNYSLIKEAFDTEDFESDLSSYTLVESLKNGLSRPAIDLLITKYNEGQSILSEHQSSFNSFQGACLEGLINSDRIDDWSHYLELFNSQSATVNYDEVVLKKAHNSNPAKTAVIDYFLKDPTKRDWLVDSLIEMKYVNFLKHLNLKNIPISHSKHPDLLDYSIKNSSPFLDESYLKFIIKDVYKYDIAKDDKNKQLLLQIKDGGVLRWLVKNGASIFQRDPMGNSYLHKSILSGALTGYHVRDTYKQYKLNDKLYQTNKQGVSIHMLLAEFEPHEASLVIDDIDFTSVDTQKNHFIHYLLKNLKPFSESSFEVRFLKLVIEKYKSDNLDINAPNDLGVRPFQKILLKIDNHSLLTDLGFISDNINPVTNEFVIVEAFQDYITQHLENKNLETVYRNFPDIKFSFKMLKTDKERDLALLRILDFIKTYNDKEKISYADAVVEELKSRVEEI